MPTKMKPAKRCGEFLARDFDGNWYTVQIMCAGTAPDTRAEVGATKVLETADGKTVNQIGQGLYEILGHPTTLIASDDPNAPWRSQ